MKNCPLPAGNRGRVCVGAGRRLADVALRRRAYRLQRSAIARRAPSAMGPQAAAAGSRLARPGHDVVRSPVRTDRGRPTNVRRLVADRLADWLMTRGAASPLWEFRAEGPIRFAPVAWNGKALCRQRRRASVLRQCRRRATRVEASRRSVESPGPRQRAADLALAGTRRAGRCQRYRLLRRRHLAVHGHFHARSRCRNRRSALDQRRRRVALHDAAAQHAVFCWRGAARRAGRRRRPTAGAGRAFGARVLRSTHGPAAAL